MFAVRDSFGAYGSCSLLVAHSDALVLSLFSDRSSIYDALTNMARSLEVLLSQVMTRSSMVLLSNVMTRSPRLVSVYAPDSFCEIDSIDPNNSL